MQLQRKTTHFKYTAKTNKGNKNIPVKILKIKIFKMYSREVLGVLKITDRNQIKPIFRIQKPSTKMMISVRRGRPWINLVESFTNSNSLS
ncbi:MAG: hypothetical protein ABSE72_03125 [Bacteroidales bacterium]|jgi:hypothetical protein